MKDMPFALAGKEDSVFSPGIGEGKWKKASIEPTSVLDTLRSPSPTSTSTLSSSFGGGGGGGNHLQKWPLSGEPVKEEWPVELVGKCGTAMDEWENMMIQSIVTPEPLDNSLLRCMMGEVEDPTKLNQGGVPFDGSVEVGLPIDAARLGVGSGFADAPCNGVSFPFMGGIGISPASKFNPFPIAGIGNAINGNCISGMPSATLAPPVSVSPGNFYPQHQDPTLITEKPHLFPFSSSLAPNLGPFLSGMPPAKRHQPGPDPIWSDGELQPNSRQSKVQFSDSGQTSLEKRHRPKSIPVEPVPDEAEQLAIVDQLHRAAELMEAGNSVHARAILARLNHQLPSPVGKPLNRAAFYFMEALLLLSNLRPVPSVVYSPEDVVLRVGAYKAFSEISPLLQFTSFTCNQAVLEALSGPASSSIHVLDFDIGIGGHWASFMQEIAPKLPGGSHYYSFKITAFTSSTHDQLELEITRESLSTFAYSLNIAFEFNALDLYSFDPSVHNLCNSSEVLVVNLPGSTHHLFPSVSMPSILQFVKQFSPKLVVSANYACDRMDLSFSQHFLHSLQFYSLLFDSLNAMNVNSNTLGKVESLLMKPKIEGILASQYNSVEKIPALGNLFLSTGFKPVPFSNYTETQAECLIKRFNLRGFHVEKHQTSIILLWQCRELVSVSVWTI